MCHGSSETIEEPSGISSNQEESRDAGTKQPRFLDKSNRGREFQDKVKQCQYKQTSFSIREQKILKGKQLRIYTIISRDAGTQIRTTHQSGTQLLSAAPFPD